MKTKSNYLFIMLEERNGEYEYLHRSVAKLETQSKNVAERVAQNYAKTFYGTPPKKEDGGYYFHEGEVFVQVDSWKFITEDEYNVLKSYL